MPRHSEEPVRSAAQRLADFERAQELRRELQSRLAEIFQIWRACDRKPCQRGRRCAGPSLATCLNDWRDKHVDNDTRTIMHAMVKARVAGASMAEVEAVADRMEARIEADRAAEAVAAASAPPLTPPASSPQRFQGRCRILE